MPLIGNGAAGWPAKTAARIHIAEVQKFASSASAMSCLKEFCFVDLDDEAVEALKQELALQQQGLQNGSKAKLPDSQDGSQMDAADIQIDSKTVPSSSPNDSNIQVIKGDITQQQVTGIVSPTNEQLCTTGQVSQHIAKAAGPKFKKDCKIFWQASHMGREVCHWAAVLSQPARENFLVSMSYMLLVHTMVEISSRVCKYLPALYALRWHWLQLRECNQLPCR